MKAKAFFLIFLLTASRLMAVAAPTGLTVTAIQTDQSALLSWNDDPVVQQWYIYLDGVLVYQPPKSSTTLNGAQRQFNLTYLPFRSPIAITMKALAPPNPISGFSAAVSTYAKPLTPIPVYLTYTVGVSVTFPTPVPQFTQIPLATVLPTATPILWPTPMPTYTAVPTATPLPTFVPYPTALTWTALVGPAGPVAITTFSAPWPTPMPTYTAVVWPTPGGLVSMNTPAAPWPATVAGFDSSYVSTSGSTNALNSAIAIDYDANSFTATTRRGAPTVNTYLATSGTTAIFTGYGLLYGWGISNPSTVTGSTVTLFDGAVTRQVMSAEVVVPYILPRGMAFTTGLTVDVQGAAFNGAFWMEHTQ
jgi:hypothetical protein